MEWISGALASILGFIVGLLPSFGQEMLYRMPLPSSVTRSEVTVLFGGDMMFDRSVRAHMQEHGEDHIFSCLGDTLVTPDVTVANLEGPITANASKSVGSVPGGPNNTKFTFATSTATLLKRQGIDIVSLANNHAQDFGPEGVRSTMRFLDDASVAHFGDPFAESEFRTTVRGVKMAFIGYNEFQDYIDEEWLPSSTTVEKIAGARTDGYMPVVFAHWGAEYTRAGEEAKTLARMWIDAGAELVIGAHPHVVQEHEEYAGKHIYYSLGNFVFDQYFSEDVRKGVLIETVFTAQGLKTVKEIPVYLERDRRTCLRAE